jgi:hypothetical protein
LLDLPDLPDSLISLFCENNMLNYLPTIPATMENLGCFNNPFENDLYNEEDIEVIRQWQQENPTNNENICK